MSDQRTLPLGLVVPRLPEIHDDDAPTARMSLPEPAEGVTEHWPPQVGEVLSDRYEVGRTLGHGGMGVVVEAMDRSLRRPVAIKLLRPSLLETGEWHERFLREARSMAALDHPNIVPVYDLGVSRNRHFLVMKLLDGESLFARLAQGPLPVQEALEIAVQVLDGLAHMHARGVVHRDIKSGNIQITDEGRPVILDFGILRRQGARRLTRLGESVGTIGYVAPELLRSAPGDARTDLYSLGVTLYEMLTGDLPFRGPSPMETLELQLHAEPDPPSVRQPTIPRAVDAAVLRAMARAAGDRFASAEEMRGALRRLATTGRARRAARTDADRAPAWVTHLLAVLLGASSCLASPPHCGPGGGSERPVPSD